MEAFIKLDLDKLNTFRTDHPNWVKDNWSTYFLPHRNEIPLRGLVTNGTVYDPIGDPIHYDLLVKTIDYCSGVNQRLRSFRHDDVSTTIGFGETRFIVPSHVVTEIPLKDYAAVPMNELARLTGTSNSDANITLRAVSENDIQMQLDSANAMLDSMTEEAKLIESGQAKELTAIKTQIDALMEQMKRQQQELMAELNRKRAEMESKKKEYEKQIFILETQIYGLRCYLGEIIDFYSVRDGKPAADDIPIVIYQKIRFLDEELGRYTSLYYYGDNEDDKDQFLTVLRDRDDMADLLAPGPKSISVVKLSRTGTIKNISDIAANMLRDYKMFHENQLALLIRNGEKLFITWLDPDKINVSDDNLYFNPGITVIEQTEEPSGYIFQKDRERKQLEMRQEMLSRWFFFNILQGILDNTNILTIPQKTNILEMNSPYVVFSMAEGWIADTRFGSFEDMLKRSADIPLAKGDRVMTGMRISRDDIYNRISHDDRWDNSRGIGEKNRTRGLSLPGKKILAVNKVIPGLKVEVKYNVCKAHIVEDPQGRPMYEHLNEDGTPDGVCSYKRSEADKIVRYMPVYTPIYDDDVIETKLTEDIISADHWYGFRGVRSYNQLSQKDLKALVRVNENMLYEARHDSDGSLRLYGTNNYKAAYDDKADLIHYRIVSCRIVGETEHHYYCALKKDGWTGSGWNVHETEYNVNFQFYRDEVIPLPFLCSSWIKAIIRNGNIGKVRLCGTYMNFADMIPYLKPILQHLQEREIVEKSYILSAGGAAWLDNDPEWDAAVCEWKIKHRYNVLTETRAKRFLKEMRTNETR